MCGITGVLQADNALSADELISCVTMMTDCLSHRGPDDAGVWADPVVGVSLGHRRLSIIDTSSAGHQPMKSASGRYVITYNGEVYNHLELLRDIQNDGNAPALRGHSDTEVILAAFERWGIPNSVERFNGMFALAVWDRAERTLWLARDPFGEKPLYYAWIGNIFLFGSELKALRAHPAFDSTLDRDALSNYLRFNCVPSPHSIYRKARKLPAASLMKIRHDRIGKADPFLYWSIEKVALDGIEHPFEGSVDDAIKQLDSLLRDAVKRRTISDVPLGVFLSGGVDSSLVTALMQAQRGGRVRTFSVGVSDKELNESVYAQQIATSLGTEHAALCVTSDEALKIIPQIAWIYDEPFSDSSQIPTLLVSRFARQSVTVALSGDGGDELFGGYNRHIWLTHLWNRAKYLSKPVRRALSVAINAIPTQGWDRMYALASPIIPKNRRFVAPGYKLQKFASVVGERNPQQMYQALLAHWHDADNIVIGAQAASGRNSYATSLSEIENQMMLLDSRRYLHDDILVKVDRASMSVGLEARAPYLDKQVATFAWRLPLKWKIRDGVGKWIVRQVLYQYVPKAIVDRPKRGFSVPLDQWLRFELREWAEALLDYSRLRQDGFLRPAPIRQKWEDHLSGRRNWAFELWDILMFQSWLDNSSSGPHARKACGVKVSADSCTTEFRP